MPTKPQSARRQPRRSSRSQTPADPDKPRCGAQRKSGGLCQNAPVKGGRCRLHVDLSDDLEALRLLQEAAARHAIAADYAIEEGENGDQDAAFNRNARTAAALARTRRALASQDAKSKDTKGADEPKIDMPNNERGDAPLREAAADGVAPDDEDDDTHDS